MVGGFTVMVLRLDEGDADIESGYGIEVLVCNRFDGMIKPFFKEGKGSRFGG